MALNTLLGNLCMRSQIAKISSLLSGRSNLSPKPHPTLTLLHLQQSSHLPHLVKGNASTFSHSPFLHQSLMMSSSHLYEYSLYAYIMLYLGLICSNASSQISNQTHSHDVLSVHNLTSCYLGMSLIPMAHPSLECPYFQCSLPLGCRLFPLQTLTLECLYFQCSPTLGCRLFPLQTFTLGFPNAQLSWDVFGVCHSHAHLGMSCISMVTHTFGCHLFQMLSHTHHGCLLFHWSTSNPWMSSIPLVLAFLGCLLFSRSNQIL